MPEHNWSTVNAAGNAVVQATCSARLMMYYMLAAKILAKFNLHGVLTTCITNLLYYHFYSLNLGKYNCTVNNP